MSIVLFMLIFWPGFRRFDYERDRRFITRAEYERFWRNERARVNVWRARQK